MDKDREQNNIQPVLQIFRKHRLKVTPQRIAIYQALLDSGAHPTADTIFQIVKTKFPHISYDTVNRTLMTLAKIGVVDIVEGFGGAKSFDSNMSRHHHLHCMKCSKIIDFKSRSYDNLQVPKDVRKKFQVISKRVVLKGICSACLE
jgi:Fur family peroxide stress response transcriptional regulator